MVPGRAYSPPPPVSASTRVEIAIPTAVRRDIIVDPLLPKEGANALSECCILMEDSSECLSDSVNLGRRAALFAERASSLDSLSIFMSESDSRSRFLIRSSISCRISGSLVSVPFLMLPGQVIFDFGFAFVDLRQLRQIVHHLISYSCHRLLQPSELSCDWGDPRGVKRLIIN